MTLVGANNNLLLARSVFYLGEPNHDDGAVVGIAVHVPRVVADVDHTRCGVVHVDVGRVVGRARSRLLVDLVGYARRDSPRSDRVLGGIPDPVLGAVVVLVAGGIVWMGRALRRVLAEAESELG